MNFKDNKEITPSLKYYKVEQRARKIIIFNCDMDY